MSITIKWRGPGGEPVFLTPRLVAAGIDWGYGDPMSCHVGAKIGPVWLILDEIYEPQLDVPQTYRKVREFWHKYKIERFWADPENPQMIKTLQGWHIPIIPNQIKDLDFGLSTVNGLLSRIITHPLLGRGPCLRINRQKCPNLIREFGRYGYPQSHGEILTKKPVDRHNHAMDDLRYMLVGEGEVPPEEQGIPLLEQPKMFLNEQGQWVDNPRAVMAQTAYPRRPGADELWWDEERGGTADHFIDD